MEKLIQQYNALDGQIVSREKINQLATDIFDAIYLNETIFGPLHTKLANLLIDNPDDTHFKINLSEKIEVPTGLGAPRHKGTAKEALTDCGRLKPGYKYVKGGKIEKVANKKEKSTVKIDFKLLQMILM